MGVDLTKGQRLNIGLSKIGVGLGWDPNEIVGGHAFDLDAAAFMLSEGRKTPSELHLVFYNNLAAPEDVAVHSGDVREGKVVGDDETIMVDLNRVDPQIQEIVFTVTIDKCDERGQNFGQVRNSFIRIYDAMTKEEICKYDLSEDFSVETAVEFGRLYRREGNWRFEALGIGCRGGLQAFVAKYM